MKRYVSILIVIAVVSLILVVSWPLIGSPLNFPGQRGTAILDVSVTRVDDGGHGSLAVAPDGRSGSINGSKATLAGENVVVVSLVIRQSPASAQSTVVVDVTVDVPSYVQQSTGSTQKLVLPDVYGCPDIVYIQGGAGTGNRTTQPCGYQGSVPAGGSQNLTMRIAINGAFFSNLSVTSSLWSLVIHTSRGNDVSVIWSVSG